MEEVLMPWTPEVFTAPYPKLDAPRVRRAPTMPAYYEGILAGQPNALVRFFAGQPRVNDPRVGHVEGVRELRAFVSRTADWLRERDAVVEKVVLHLLWDEGGRVELPVAIVTDRNPDRTLKATRVYHSMWPLTGEHALRPPLLPADLKLHAQGVVGDYQRALAEGDLESIVETCEPDGYAREPSCGAYVHRGAEGLRELYAHLFANGGGIPLEHCTLADDGVRCAVEYNCVRW